MASESELIAALSEVFLLSDPNLIVGIGDDGAVIKASTKNLVAATDMAVEGVHFKREWSNLHDIGAKIAAANLADIFAMGGDPRYLLVSAGLTKDFGIAEIQELAQGIKSEADLVGAAIIGGDISRAEQLVISITALGEVVDPILRSGAKVGDQIYLSNLPGWSRAGLAILVKGLPIETDAAKRAVAAFRAPTLNYAYAVDLANATALSDVSDSLMTQSEQMAAASNVKFDLDFNLFKAAADFEELRTLSEELNVSVADLIFGGGEDHVFLATGEDLPGLLIGNVSAGNGLTVLGNEKAPDTWRHFD